MEFDVVKSEIPEIDGCPLYRSVKAFLVDQGVKAVLEHQLRGRDGLVLNLSSLFPSGESESESEDAGTGSIKIRIKEVISTALSPTTNPLWEVPAWVVDAENGIVRCKLTAPIVELAGIYEVGYGIMDGDDVVAIDSAVMSVESSLFAARTSTILQHKGPPSLLEIRSLMMDRDRADNSLINRVEFSTDQILQALVQPIQYFNDQPPPLGEFTTRNFPWRSAWQDATIGNLLVMAAHNYRRNTLPYSAGGISIDDKNKEREYLAYAQQLLQGYKDFVLNKKVELNAQLMTGHIGSAFGRRRV